MNSQTVNVVKTSEIVKRNGFMDARIVLWKKEPNEFLGDDLFCTHIECIPDGSTRQGNQPQYFCHGHYDMTLIDAEYDYQKRVSEL